MDTRMTLNSKESFFQILKDLQTSAEKASLLYDDGGLTRYEGLIAEIDDAAVPRLMLANGVNIPVSAVIAVNGIFVPAYSEC